MSEGKCQYQFKKGVHQNQLCGRDLYCSIHKKHNNINNICTQAMIEFKRPILLKLNLVQDFYKNILIVILYGMSGDDKWSGNFK